MNYADFVPLTYANCFGADRDTGRLATDEPLVAEAAPSRLEVVFADQLIEADKGQSANIALWQLAFDWFLTAGDDPTIVGGVSVGDLAGAELAQSVLLPAARGALAMSALLDELRVDRVRTAIAIAGSESFRRAEMAQCAGAEAAVRVRLGAHALSGRIRSDDPRNDLLVAKYAHVRDPWLQRDRFRHRARVAVAEQVTRCGRALRRDQRGALLVHEYNPTQAFATEYARRPDRPRLVRIGPNRSALHVCLATGDVIARLPSVPPVRRASEFRANLEAWADLHAGPLLERSVVGDVPLWDAVRSQVLDVVDHYAAYAAVAVPTVEALLRRERVERVLVPFDSPPSTRLLVRLAQRSGIPTFVINNGIMPDEFQAECLTADVGLAWSDAVAQTTFRRRTSGITVVTGNPKGDRPRRRVTVGVPPGRVLIGSFTFSPVDLNCRRSDAERYLEQVLRGVADGAPDAILTLKLHPADTPVHYASVLGRARIECLRVVTHGDVCTLFGAADVYITTYSTSLLEAAACGLPVLYYAVNEQRFQAPFEGDPYLERWTARTPAELARLLRCLAAERPDPDDLAGWASEYLGPLDGRSVERVASALASIPVPVPVA